MPGDPGWRKLLAQTMIENHAILPFYKTTINQGTASEMIRDSKVFVKAIKNHILRWKEEVQT